jgi:hypothetical protein
MLVDVARGKMFFFENLHARYDWRGPQGSKVFCFFFSKKKFFLSCPSYFVAASR